MQLRPSSGRVRWDLHQIARARVHGLHRLKHAVLPLRWKGHRIRHRRRLQLVPLIYVRVAVGTSYVHLYVDVFLEELSGIRFVTMTRWRVCASLYSLFQPASFFTR